MRSLLYNGRLFKKKNKMRKSINSRLEVPNKILVSLSLTASRILF